MRHVQSIDQRPRYTQALANEMARVHMPIRGRNSTAEQSGISVARLEDIMSGSTVTQKEHRALCRALPRMKAYGNLLLEMVDVSSTSSTPPVPPTTSLALVSGPTNPAPSNESASIETSDSPPPSRPSQPIHEEPATLVATPHTSEPSIKPRTFGEWLRAYREQHGLRSQDVADLVGVAQGTYGKWENDDFVPVEENYAKLLDLYPALRTKPKPKVRDIDKPIGNTNSYNRTSSPTPEPKALTTDNRVPTAPASTPTPTVQASTTPSTTGTPSSLIRFGVMLAKVRTVPIIERQLMIELFKAGHAAGLDIDSIAREIAENEP